MAMKPRTPRPRARARAAFFIQARELLGEFFASPSDSTWMASKAWGAAMAEKVKLARFLAGV